MAIPYLSAMGPDAFTSYRVMASRLAGQAGTAMHNARTRWLAMRRAGQVASAIALAILVIWLLLLVTQGRFLKQPFQAVMSSHLGREVRVNGSFQLYFAPISIKLRADEISIANASWAKERRFFSARSIDMRVATFPLLWGRRTIKDLTLEDGTIDLQWSRDGKANTWTFGGGPADRLELPDVRRARISGSRVHYSDPRVQLTGDFAIDQIDAQDKRVEDAVRFSGGGTMREQPFTLTGQLQSPNEMLTGGENRITLAARSGDTSLDITGTLPGPTELKGSRLQLVARGPTLRHLFDFIGVAAPETPPYRLRSSLTYTGREWRFTRINGFYGESDVAGSMTIARPKDRLMVTADLHTEHLHMADVAPLVGYRPAAARESDADDLLMQVMATPRILPDMPLRIDAMRAFDARIDYAARSVVDENVPLSNIGLSLTLDQGKMTLSPLTFLMAGGLFASDVIIDARGQPVKTSYDIRLSPTPMGRLLARWGVEESGTSGTIRGRIQLEGLGDTVRESLATSNGRIAVIMPAGTMWARNVQLSELDIGLFIQRMFERRLREPVEINCGLIAFTVRDGIASADPILIDTRKNVIVGRGAIDFRNERVDLAMRADAKRFSLFSGQSPVGIEGYFASPSLQPVSPQLFGRAGAGIAAGSLFSPLAALLAFVDVGDAKGTDCTPVLAGQSAVSQRTDQGTPRDDVGRGTSSRRENGR